MHWHYTHHIFFYSTLSLSLSPLLTIFLLPDIFHFNLRRSTTWKLRCTHELQYMALAFCAEVTWPIATFGSSIYFPVDYDFIFLITWKKFYFALYLIIQLKKWVSESKELYAFKVFQVKKGYCHFKLMNYNKNKEKMQCQQSCKLDTETSAKNI